MSRTVAWIVTALVTLAWTAAALARPVPPAPPASECDVFEAEQVFTPFHLWEPQPPAGLAGQCDCDVVLPDYFAWRDYVDDLEAFVLDVEQASTAVFTAAWWDYVDALDLLETAQIGDTSGYTMQIPSANGGPDFPDPANGCNDEVRNLQMMQIETETMLDHMHVLEACANLLEMAVVDLSDGQTCHPTDAYGEYLDDLILRALEANLAVDEHGVEVLDLAADHPSLTYFQLWLSCH